MSYLKILFLMLCMTFVSCTGQRTEKKDDNNDKVTIEVEEIKFPPQDILQLKSYYLSSSVHVDSTDYLIGYNYRSHSLDCMNLQSKSVTQIILPGDGPDAIVRLSGIYVQSLDSIWISDESERAFLIDSVGMIKRTIDLKKYLEEQEQLLINTNYAMFTSHLFYNTSRHSLMFLAKNTASDTFVVKEIFTDKDKAITTYQLSSSKIVPDMSKGYAYINFPNVNFVGENIVYNYPVESSIYTLNIKTNERKYILADSRYTSNIIEKCTTTGDYATLEKHWLENPHFYDVMYLPKYKMYVRLHADKVDFDEKKGMEKLINERDLYLMLFDEYMEKIGEVKLSNCRYSPFTGWSAAYGGIAFFVDNILDNKNNTDDLTIDMIFPE
ncbi:DUF4221 domain-containing protein [Bacteroides sp. HF-5092]|uniref:DUF4221 family protein n=1 Tax=Bacteroides TaxID=816 RepID=UPI00117746B3|nr:MULTISPECIES: DUF4221 family protein [Bacteroides]TRX45167.1 DUF4221 domain-containing protein [Bacteroides sp. HF-5092]